MLSGIMLHLRALPDVPPVLPHTAGYQLTRFLCLHSVFGISRALGCLPQLVMDRALGMPIERPKSMSMAALETLLKK